jgi:hypothetical protein
MTKTTLGYTLLLVAAFLVGLVGTLAASRAVLRAGAVPAVVHERPVSAPTAPRPRVVRRTVDC